MLVDNTEIIKILMGIAADFAEYSDYEIETYAELKSIEPEKIKQALKELTDSQIKVAKMHVAGELVDMYSPVLLLLDKVQRFRIAFLELYRILKEEGIIQE